MELATTWSVDIERILDVTPINTRNKNNTTKYTTKLQNSFDRTQADLEWDLHDSWSPIPPQKWPE